jgi:membrane fusion protein, multidrug efflux system
VSKAVTKVMGGRLRTIKLVTVVGLLLAAAGGALAVTRTSIFRSTRAQAPAAPQTATPPPVSIVAAPVKSGDVPIYLRGVGTVIAYNNVLIRSQITGQLVKINFRQGQTVKKGDILAVIDPTPYQAQLDQAIANRERDQAHLVEARVDLNRYKGLEKQNAIASQAVDSQRAIVDQLVAMIKADEAVIQSAQVYLGYTKLTSPIDGVTGIRFIDIGNVIHPTDVNGLVDVTQIEPISLIFTLPEADFVPIQEHMSKGPVTVFVDDQNGKQLDQGQLNLIDNQIIQTTGTIRLRAEFPNKNHLLWPGQLVDARLLLDTRHKGLTVPESAVLQGPKGAYTYVVKPNNTIEVQPIKVAQISSGQALIDSGLAAKEQVVTDGQYKLKPGDHVKILTGKAAEEAAAQSAEQAEQAPIP